MKYNEEFFMEIFKRNNVKITHQRKSILKLLCEYEDEHFTVYEMQRILKDEDNHIGLATIYRSLQIFLEMKIVYKIEVMDGYTRYELSDEIRGERKPHYHMICEECGKITPFYYEDLKNLDEGIYEKFGFTVDNHDLKIYGKCNECIKKMRHSG